MGVPAEAAVCGQNGPTDRGRKARQHLTTVPFAGQFTSSDHKGFMVAVVVEPWDGQDPPADSI